MQALGESAAQERSWQEAVVQRLSLRDWEVIEVNDELELVGSIAQDVLLRHGALWPPNVRFYVPQLQRSGGGSLLTGIGGDEIFAPSGWWRLQRLADAVPEPARCVAARIALAPPRLRERLVVARSELALPWLRPAVPVRVARQARPLQRTNHELRLLTMALWNAGLALLKTAGEPC